MRLLRSPKARLRQRPAKCSGQVPCSALSQRRAAERLVLQTQSSRRCCVPVARTQQQDNIAAVDETVQDSTSNGQRPEPSAPTTLFNFPTLLRKVLATQTAFEALEVITQDEKYIASLTKSKETVGSSGRWEGDCNQLLAMCLERGNTSLAMSIYQEMCTNARSSSSGALAGTLNWPSVTIGATTSIVLGLTRALQVNEALRVVDNIKLQGLPTAADLQFGFIVTCPLPPKMPLAVVQPQDGVKVVTDSFTRYEYELFSGSVVSCKSEALNAAQNLFIALARRLGLRKTGQVAAVHEFVVQTPDGFARTFRFGTETADVPAKVGDRITVVCSPTQGKSRYRRLLSASPPGTRPGEAMSVANHTTKAVVELLRAPPSTSTQGISNLLVPTLVLLAGSDAATGLIDPSLPAIVAVGAALTAGSAVMGNQLLLPRLKQLPDQAIKVEYMRQRLLQQHNALVGKVGIILAEVAEDLRALARLWQLQNKMESVGNKAAYDARRERVTRAAENLEERVKKQLDLLDGYSRVMRMIEIEVEMEIEVPAAEYAGIEAQINRLVELESLQEDWRTQAEARDEVERLLKSA